ncbi:antifreeze protein [Thalassorhabdomicrobium marinisediminis]|uniref:antifreeze protein n=1 Tax=Thalassorhabdomicrobium marinisediminis TaxID=2170577 RepID=UPI0024905132|nr:antifreeze protein [Thalassorhabdomicrobium marinisediminis]
MTPSDLIAMNMRLATLMVEAGTVMNLRLLGMTGALPARRGETRRMVDEKASVAAQSYMAASTAMMAGKPPLAIYEAALKPVSSKVSANRKRLSKL